jgi:hypothetical protein
MSRKDQCLDCYVNLGNPFKIESKTKEIPEPQSFTVTEYGIPHFTYANDVLLDNYSLE